MREFHFILCYFLPAAALLASMAVSAAASESGAPLWPSAPTARIAIVADAPDMDADEPLADPAWEASEPIVDFLDDGTPEAAERRTEIRLLESDGTLFIGARMNEPEPARLVPGAAGVLPTKDDEAPVVDDSLEFYYTEGADAEFPYVRVRLSAGGHASVTRLVKPFSRWKQDEPAEVLDASDIVVRTGVGDDGWWLVAALPMARHRIPSEGFHANFVRHRKADESRYAWVDLRGVAIHFPYHFGKVSVADGPLEPRPRVELPAFLAVGANVLHFADWSEGWRLFLDGAEAAVTDGAAEVEIAERGLVRIAIVDPDGGTSAVYSCEVKRPLIINAVNPFVETVPDAIDVELTLSVTARSVPVTIKAVQEGRTVGTAKVTAAPGLTVVAVPCPGATAGEVTLLASAGAPGVNGTLDLTARHRCVVGQAPSAYDRFRDGIDDLDTRGKYRAGLADAMNFYRLIQSGDGRYPMLSDDGRRRFSEWYYGLVYAAALLYETDWPENPWRGDERFLESAVAGMEAGLDPAAEYPAGGYDRHLQAYLLTYELLKDDIEPARARYWRERLFEITQHTLESFLRPGEFLFTFYSDEVGTSTNHFAYYAANLYTAGRVLERPDWDETGRALMLGIARHETDGHFPERRGVPVPHYTRLSMNALGQYYVQSGDESVRDALERCAEFSCHTSLPDCDVMLLHEGRTSWYRPFEFGEFVLSYTTHGRWLARRLVDRHISSERTPGRSSPEWWFRDAENALYFEGGPTEALPEDAEFSFLDGRGLIARRNGFIYGLSAISKPPTDRLYWLDPQNTVELHHESAGPILHGANSIMQPEAGSFLREAAGKTVFMPYEGVIEKTPSARFAEVHFDGFKARLSLEVIDARRVRITVDLLSAEGEGPVIYSFFPGMAEDDELHNSADGKSLTFRNVTINSSRPVELERGFLMTSPYSLEREVRTKPVRAFTALEPGRPLVLDISVAETAE